MPRCASCPERAIVGSGSTRWPRNRLGRPKRRTFWLGGTCLNLSLLSSAIAAPVRYHSACWAAARPRVGRSRADRVFTAAVDAGVVVHGPFPFTGELLPSASATAEASALRRGAIAAGRLPFFSCPEAKRGRELTGV